MVMHVVDCFLFYYLTHSVWLHESLPWDWLLYSADICVFLLPLCAPSVPTPSFSDSPSILSFSLLVFWWAVGLVCSSALAFCSSWLVLFKIWFCPIQLCTVRLPLLQTTLISSFLFLRSFLCTPSNFPVSLFGWERQICILALQYCLDPTAFTGLAMVCFPALWSPR